MGLNFPNASRSHDAAGHGVRFWGYDRTFEIAFFVEEQALAKMGTGAETDEGDFLQTFDDHLDRIRQVASDIYARRRKASYIYAYTLSDSDF